METGIPKDYKVERLFFNKPSNKLVVACRELQPITPFAVLYARDGMESRYCQVPLPDGRISIEGALTSPTTPEMFYSAFRFDGGSGDWLGIFKVDLLNLQIREILSKGELLLPPPFDDAGVFDLLGFDASQNELLCKIMLRVIQSNTASYFIASLSLHSKRVKINAKLLRAFF